MAGLVRALAADPRTAEELMGSAFTMRGRGALAAHLPPRVPLVGAPVPARALHRAWARSEMPTVTTVAGRMDLFHATNFVLPPTGRAIGVVTVHDLSFLRSPRSVSPASEAYRVLVPRSLARARAVCVPSAAIADEVQEAYGLPEEFVHVTPLGVDPAWTAAEPPDEHLRARLSLPARYLVFSGSLEPRKNLPFLLEVHARLTAEDPGWPPLVLTGPPGWGPRLDLSAHTAGSVVLTGWLPDDDLRRVVAGSLAVVYPTRYEGFGLPPLEAFATGTAVVATDLPVVREVVGPAQGLAHLVRLDDHDAWAESLRSTVYEQPDPGAAAGRRARAAQFSWSDTADATRRAWTSALRGR